MMMTALRLPSSAVLTGFALSSRLGDQRYRSERAASARPGIHHAPLRGARTEEAPRDKGLVAQPYRISGLPAIVANSAAPAEKEWLGC